MKDKTTPAEMNIFTRWMIGIYDDMGTELNQLEYLIGLKIVELNEDIFSKFSALLDKFRFVSTKYLPAVYRNHGNDLLSLKLLNWLHGEHLQTKDKPFLIQDGNFSILPAVGLPISYYLPVVSQHSLLYMPLFFHEIGHYFYQAHAMEMNDLVKQLQNNLDVILQPPFQSNKEQAEKSRRIVETWYEWCQELFCDAVGLEIGGRTYLKAFSYYLRMQGPTSLQLPEKDLANSSHPVSWLRIKFLVERARKHGLANDANQLETEWNSIARTLRVTEDYFGYYASKYHTTILQTLDDMIEEASPILYKDYLGHSTSNITNFIQVIHDAWDQFETNPGSYEEWEKSNIKLIIE